TVLSVEKALLIIELLMRDENPLSAREIAARLGINRTTAHRLLNAFVRRGWLEKVPAAASYRLSLKFLALAQVSSQSRSFVLEVRPALERLSRVSRETVHLGVLDGYDVVHVDKVDSPQRIGISSKIGTRAAPHVTGLGKALLAGGSDAFLDEYLEHGRTRPAPYTIKDPGAVRAEIRATRERGYSIDNEEDSIGVRCLGVAIRGAGGEPVFAISLTGPSPRFTLAQVAACAPDVTATARALSLQFGWEPSLELDATADGREEVGRADLVVPGSTVGNG
ncbi:MAG TPA: IclR family transcriptional regulator, partial [Thermomicrobiales bacterium]|nr:IclR family transcriptional regulator [Thermomicrobiales bacterium]